MDRAASSVVIALLFERNSFVNDFYDICSLQEIVYEGLWDQAGHNLKVICAMHDLSISVDMLHGWLPVQKVSRIIKNWLWSLAGLH